MALYISTPVGTKKDDLLVRKSLLEKTLLSYAHKGMEVWLRGRSPENPGDVIKTFEEVLGQNYSEEYFLTVQARRTSPDGTADRFDPNNYYDLTSQRGVDNLLTNAEAAKKLGAQAVVVAPWMGVFKYPEGYREEFENPSYRMGMVNLALKNAKKISEEMGIRVALEHSTVPLYGDFNANINGSMFDLGFGLFEHTNQIPGDMLVMDTCHIESARNITSRLTQGQRREETASTLRRSNDLVFVPGVMNYAPQPHVLEAIERAKPFEVHYAGFKGDWNPYSNPPTTHIEGSVPGGKDDVIGEKTFKELTDHLHMRAQEYDYMIERHFKNPQEEEDVVIVAEPNEEDFMNPINSKETLAKICRWMYQV